MQSDFLLSTSYRYDTWMMREKRSKRKEQEKGDIETDSDIFSFFFGKNNFFPVVPCGLVA
jgi:hypothetical protein